MKASNWKGMGSFGTVGLEIVIGIVLGLLGGRWLDNKFHTAPYITIVGFCLGLVTAVKAVHRTWREMQRVTEAEEREQGNPAPIYDPELDAKDRDKSEDSDKPEDPVQPEDLDKNDKNNEPS